MDRKTGVRGELEVRDEDDTVEVRNAHIVGTPTGSRKKGLEQAFPHIPGRNQSCPRHHLTHSAPRTKAIHLWY